MRYLITGAAGFVGSHLTDALVTRGDSVIALDDLSTGRWENLARALASGRVEVVEGSTSDEQLVEKCMSRADRCVHLAAAVGMKLIMSDPLESLLSNVRGTDTVLGAAARHRRRLIFASTSEVYGKLNAPALHEESGCVLGSPFKSRWSYAIAKSFGEAAAHAYGRDRGAEMTVIRLFNAVGARQTGAYGMVLPRFVGQALSGKPVTVYGDGTHARCFTSVHDVIRGILDLFATDASIGQAYNIGASNPVRILDLAESVLKRTGSTSPIEFVPYADIYGQEYEELECRVADTSAIAGLTGWTTSRAIDEIVDEVIEDKRAEMALAAQPAELRSLALAA